MTRLSYTAAVVVARRARAKELGIGQVKRYKKFLERGRGKLEKQAYLSPRKVSVVANHGRWLAKSLPKGSASDRPRQTSL